jgi:hypothetical protein
MQDKNHFAWGCSVCLETYPTEKERKEHEINTHYYCEPCDRHFRSFNNIKMVRAGMNYTVV